MKLQRILGLLVQTTPEERSELYRALARHGIHLREFDPDEGTIAVVPQRLTPEMAYNIAVRCGHAEALKRVAAQSPQSAYNYARWVNGPCHETRTAACRLSNLALDYASHVDKSPRDDTRTAACKTPESAIGYALHVDVGPCDETREAACREPGMAYRYAVFEGPHDATRAAACRHPKTALDYALDVDKGPHPLTREGAAREWEQTQGYIFRVEKGHHEVLWAAVKHTPFAKWYRDFTGYRGT